MIDVSEFQGVIAWNRVPKSERVLIRVSYGTTGIDKHGSANVAGALAAGLQVGVYHFLEDHDPAAEIAHFLATAGHPQHTFKLRGMIDVEPSDFSHPTKARVEGALDAYHKAAGFWPIVYGNTGVLAGLHLAERFAACPLMIADYGPNDGARHAISGATPAPWNRVDVHQYTSVGSCTGVSGHVDQSVILTKGTIQVPGAPVKHFKRPKGVNTTWSRRDGTRVTKRFRGDGWFKLRHPRAIYRGTVHHEPIPPR